MCSPSRFSFVFATFDYGQIPEYAPDGHILIAPDAWTEGSNTPKRGLFPGLILLCHAPQVSLKFRLLDSDGRQSSRNLIFAALVLTRLMSHLLFSVTPHDPLTFPAVSVLLMLVTLLACYLPARGATLVDPLVALRYE